MEIVEISVDCLFEAPWNPNEMDPATLSLLTESIKRHGVVENFVVRPIGNGTYEVLSGNHRLRVLRRLGELEVPCLVVALDDARARLLAQALNRIRGDDNLGLRAELVRVVLTEIPKSEVLSVLPDTAETLSSLASLGQEDMAKSLQAWQLEQDARLRHLQFQLTAAQIEVVEEAMATILPRARASDKISPNARGTALHLLCSDFLERDGGIE